MLESTNSPVKALLLALALQSSLALKCRSEDGPTEAELKRVTRSCMRKVAENVHFNGGSSSGSGGGGGGGGSDVGGSNNGFGNNGYNGGSNTNFHYGGSNGYHYNNNNYNNNNYGQQNKYQSDYDSDENSNGSENGAYNYERGNGNSANGGRDIFQQRNLERSPILNNRNGNGGSNSNAGGRSNVNMNPNTGNSNNNNNNKYAGNQRNSNQKSYNNGRSSTASHSAGRGMNSQFGENNRNNGSTHDTGCVVHCFFEEMSMLNRDDYPDKHKVMYMLTKDLRDRELRNFYTDTIQSCFRYLEAQRRRGKCQFSRELIQCMAEHAKANCDDWDEYNVMFN